MMLEKKKTTKPLQPDTATPAVRWGTVLLGVLVAAVAYGIYAAYRDTQAELRPVFLPPLAAPPLPAADVFEEQPELLASITDATLPQMADLQPAALAHLLHKARVSDFDAMGQLPRLEIAQISPDDRRAMRARAFVARGLFQRSWTVRLPDGNASGLAQATMGFLQPVGSETIFFVLEQDPAWGDFYTNDQVEITGFFFKRHVDEALRLNGSVLVGRAMRKAPLPEFHDDWDEVAQAIDDAEETGGIFTLGADAYYYFLHKVLSEEPGALSRAAAPLDYVALSAMINSPQSVRGKAVRLRGQIAKPFARKILPQPNRVGLGSVWEGQIFLRLDGQDVLFVLNFPQRPEVVDGAVVEFEGYFVQRFAYKQAVGRTATVAPFLVGRGIRHVR